MTTLAERRAAIRAAQQAAAVRATVSTTAAALAGNGPGAALPLLPVSIPIVRPVVPAVRRIAAASLTADAHAEGGPVLSVPSASARPAKTPRLTDGKTDKDILRTKREDLTPDQIKRKKFLIAAVYTLNKPKKSHGLGDIIETSFTAPIKFAIRTFTVPIRTAKAIKSGKLKGADARRALGDIFNPITATMKVAGATEDNKRAARALNYGRMGSTLTWKTGTNRRIKSHGFAGVTAAAVVAATVLTFGGDTALLGGGAAVEGGGATATAGVVEAGSGAVAATGTAVESGGFWASVKTGLEYVGTGLTAVKGAKGLTAKKKPQTAADDQAAAAIGQKKQQQQTAATAAGAGTIALIVLGLLR